MNFNQVKDGEPTDIAVMMGCGGSYLRSWALCTAIPMNLDTLMCLSFFLILLFIARVKGLKFNYSELS